MKRDRQVNTMSFDSAALGISRCYNNVKEELPKPAWAGLRSLRKESDTWADSGKTHRCLTSKLWQAGLRVLHLTYNKLNTPKSTSPTSVNHLCSLCSCFIVSLKWFHSPGGGKNPEKETKNCNRQKFPFS